jgi:DNA processing protein
MPAMSAAPGVFSGAARATADDRDDWLQLALRPRVYAARLRPALLQFDGPRGLLRSEPDAWRAVGGSALVDALQEAPHPAQLDAARDWLARADAHLIPLGDAAYPALLATLPNPPLVLFAQGQAALLQGPAVAVVGSRNPTPAGAENARAFAGALAAAGITVVSGLARGIDGTAHAAALPHPGSTVAVLGVGPDISYPKAHRGLQAAIAEGGCVLSEYPPGMAAQRYSFPRRNRIIAGLSLGCLVVEAAVHSGSLITAREAVDAGREVFAIPGSIHSPQSRGCHRLIRQGAVLVETLDDILSALPLAPVQACQTSTVIDTQTPACPDHNDHPLLRALGDAPTALDLVIERSGLDVANAMAELTALELDGRVARCADGRYQRLWL